jgi:hypothetical protein
MAEFFARTSEFGSAIIGYWYVWLTAVPFFLDQVLSRNFWSKETLERFDKKWPPDGRHRFFKWVCIIGFVVASFQAFDHVNGELKDAALKNDTLKADLKSANDQLAEARRQLAESLKWRPLTPSTPLVQNQPIQPAIKILPGGKNATLSKMRIHNGNGIAVETDAANTKMNEVDIGK